MKKWHDMLNICFGVTPFHQILDLPLGGASESPESDFIPWVGQQIMIPESSYDHQVSLWPFLIWLHYLGEFVNHGFRVWQCFLFECMNLKHL